MTRVPHPAKLAGADDRIASGRDSRRDANVRSASTGERQRPGVRGPPATGWRNGHTGQGHALLARGGAGRRGDRIVTRRNTGMRTRFVVRWFAALLLLGLFGLSQTARAQEGGDAVNSELGAGLYLGNCDSLVEGAALFDLGDLELETESFENTDENEEGSGEDDGEGDLEDQINEESSEDETDVEGAIVGGEDDEDEGEGETEQSDSEVVVQGDAPLVWVSTGTTFAANLVELVDAPFAVAIRMDATDEADSEETGGEDGEFLACGEFGGAVAGNQIIIPLTADDGSDFFGIVILARSENEGETTAAIYLVGESTQDGGDEDAEATPDA